MPRWSCDPEPSRDEDVVDICSVDICEVELLGEEASINLLDIRQAGRTHINRVPSPPLHFPFSISEDLHAGAIDDGATREGKWMGVSVRRIFKGHNEHTYTDVKSNMTALIGLLHFTPSFSLVPPKLTGSFHNLVFFPLSINCGLLFAFSLKYPIIVRFTEDAFGYVKLSPSL